MREVRISAQGLTPGMFVSRLDKPWLETPFPMEGIALRCAADVARLQRICSHVWVDLQRGAAPELRYYAFESPAPSKAAQDEYDRLRSTRWQIQSDLKAELREAEQAHASIEASLQEVMQDLLEGKRLDVDKLKDGVEAMIDSILRNPAALIWLREMKQKDHYAYQHALGCSIWAASFGRHLGLEREELRVLALAGLLCDVGKTRLPRWLLDKAEPYSRQDQLDVRAHVQHGLDILAQNPDLPAAIVEIVATHHERHDGSGYPKGLSGTEIPMFGRIMGIVDSYDAMTSNRPHAPARSPHDAINELYRQRGVLFQQELVEHFIQSCGIYPIGTLVELSDGQVGVITEIHSLKRLLPRVMLLLDGEKRPLSRFREIDLSQLDQADPSQRLTIRKGLPNGSFGLDPVELFLA
jgi:HD-GYP domain-containing protein (c-di-GMP phosphodiesterase class II)